MNRPVNIYFESNGNLFKVMVCLQYESNTSFSIMYVLKCNEI